MPRKAKSSHVTVATVNGWQIERYKFGARTYWQAFAVDDHGYQVARHDAPSRREAEEWAAANAVPVLA